MSGLRRSSPVRLSFAPILCYMPKHAPETTLLEFSLLGRSFYVPMEADKNVSDGVVVQRCKTGDIIKRGHRRRARRPSLLIGPELFLVFTDNVVAGSITTHIATEAAGGAAGVLNTRREGSGSHPCFTVRKPSHMKRFPPGL